MSEGQRQEKIQEIRERDWVCNNTERERERERERDRQTEKEIKGI